ncbi:FAD-dependent oxidoreductase [Leucobacter sp. G161]|uniref:FAD-dependent oxidoreductase n=1 Tax=Leucobacter sp. G161 TaxID=663704 RepID=UPI00073BE855|nr:FAD-dependent oxidoreductase [Leucobacter sp. G161]KUF07585.1 flavoprotein [Leucobacter sp. G161]
MTQQHPVLVIGAGPIGLAAAAQLHERGEPFVVLEAGQTAAAAVASWQHVRLFSTWRYNIAPAARRLLAAPSCAGSEWQEPRETRLPTGSELIDEYLAPLAAHPAIAPRLRLGHRVTHVSRVTSAAETVDKTRSTGRAASLFLVRAETATGPTDFTARAVIDASGTWSTPNPVGRSGIPAIGEAGARDAGLVTGPLPDVLGADRSQFARRTTLVLGSGHSAATTLIALGRLRQQEPDTRILWGIRGEATPDRLYGGGAADELPARGQLGASLRRLVESGGASVLEHVSVTGLRAGNRLTVTLADGRELQVDRLVPATGFRPDLGILSELRLALDDAVDAPHALGPLIDPEFHSCGTVSAHGARELAHPEPGFFIVGSKSYGRAPTFLLATGYEQVRSVVAALAGDDAEAAAVELTLPRTGVCTAS